MSGHQPKAMPAGRRATLNDLKDELYSLNMRLLLAMRHHNEEAQKEIEAQMAAVQAEIDRMCLGGGFRSDSG